MSREEGGSPAVGKGVAKAAGSVVSLSREPPPVDSFAPGSSRITPAPLREVRLLPPCTVRLRTTDQGRNQIA